MGKYNTVLITGASAGLGEEFAHQLKYDSDEMILVARRGERLREIANALKADAPDLKVWCVELDLTDPEKRSKFIHEMHSNEMQIDLLVNNAGMGDYGRFAESDWQKLDQMIQLNVTALTHLTHGLIPIMRGQEKASIINVSSLASILPIPDFSVYAATKAYVTSFSEALRIELKGDNISVLALCPGPVHTEFGSVAMRADQDNKLPGREQFYVEKSEVVERALRAVEKNKPREYPGWKIGLAAAGITILPLAILRLVMAKRIQ